MALFHRFQALFFSVYTPKEKNLVPWSESNPGVQYTSALTIQYFVILKVVSDMWWFDAF
jgi:hypothetical protein